MPMLTMHPNKLVLDIPSPAPEELLDQIKEGLLFALANQSADQDPKRLAYATAVLSDFLRELVVKEHSKF
jgi:hypothetical protein